MSKASASADYAKILVVRFSSLGDIVLTTPVLMALRARYPEAQIDYLLKEQYLPLLQNHPSRCGLIPLSEELRKDSGAYLQFCDTFRDKGYGLVVDLQGNGRSYVLRKRVFRDWVKVGKQTLKRILLIKFGIGREKYPDVRRRFLRPLRDLGIDDRKVPARAVLAVEDCEKEVARGKFLGNNQKNGSLIAIHPGSKWASKEWGLEKFIQLAKELIEENIPAIERGAGNLVKQIENVAMHGVPVVVAINRFLTDTDAEIEAIRRIALEAGAADAVASELWAKGGEGGEALAEAVVKAAETPSLFKFLYPLDASIKEKIETIATKIYGADGVEYLPAAEKQISLYTKQGFAGLPVCMAKTHLSLSHDPALKGRPKGFRVPVREVRASIGAGFLYPLLGDMRTMPGLPTEPAGAHVDIDETGKTVGLF